MSKDFNSDMFSAILKANENSMALLEKQLGEAQLQAKRNDIKFYVTLSVLGALLAGMIVVYCISRPTMNLDYGQGIVESELVDSNVDYKNKIDN